MRAISTVMVGLVSVGNLLAQAPHRPTHSPTAFVCNYTGQKAPEITCTYDPNRSHKHAENVVDRILKPIGLLRNFNVMECANTQNCFATVMGGQRFVIYDGAFMQRIDDVTNTDWSAISIMAHEIGHHLQGHTIDGKGARPQKELEADKFSGFVLHQLGASLEESFAAIRALGSDYPSATHPARAPRLEAIRKGWLEAEEMYPRSGSGRPNAPVTSRPVAQRQTTPPATVTRNPEAAPVPASPRTATPKPAVIAANKVGCVSGNCQDGFGTYVLPTREKYVGEFVEGDKHGQGTQYYPDGRLKYKGVFQDDERAGFGTYYFRNGDRYVGQFFENAPNGKGTYYFSDGDRFVGNFRQGKRNGFGTLYDSDGDKQEAGQYEDDELIN
ncbi:MAG: hypothetical protein EAZ91_01480 [Cytophagales bacterium]|nr:MAG: hypothetical protein EAZ91_01480 [Cytophagales bacterium]